MKQELRAFLAALATSVLVTPALAYPSKPVTVVVPFTPGGAVDIVARTIADGLSRTWTQPAIVDNKPGGNGSIGIRAVVHAPPDGHTLLLGSVGPLTIMPTLKPAGFDASKDLMPIVLLAKTPAVLVVPASSPVRDVKDFVQQAEGSKKPLNFGSAGTGNITHLSAEYFLSNTKVVAQHIPYKGSAPAINDMLGGQLDFMFDVVPTAQQFVKDRKFRALAVTTARRSSVLPDVPTLQELGYRDFDVSSWFGLFAPAGTPPEVVKQINEAVNTLLDSSAIQQRLSTVGAISEGGTPGKLSDLVKSETSRWKRVIDQRGIKAD